MNLLLSGNAQPTELVLCTFTQKAGFELRDRISAAAAKLRYAGDLSQLRVSTIHGLCNRLLTTYRHRTPLGNSYQTLDELTRAAVPVRAFRQDHRPARRRAVSRQMEDQVDRDFRRPRLLRQDHRRTRRSEIPRGILGRVPVPLGTAYSEYRKTLLARIVSILPISRNWFMICCTMRKSCPL